MLKILWKFSDFLCFLLALIIIDVTAYITQGTLIFGIVLAVSFVALGLLFSAIGGKGGD
ncbi:DUF1056 family protein [Pediococcus claussenii]|uniref:DUF1056 family protein n=1 Tax=Pediococcus claussenii TaxID=187452 RepID=UPI0009F17450|nr:DUF1056 family protein [Pediococcus claussenii]